MTSASPPTPRPRRRWPVLVALGVILGVALALVWMRHEVERTRFRTQGFGFPDPASPMTNQPSR